jgi:diguanylate cyclase (GGDEF)-like protein
MPDLIDQLAGLTQLRDIDALDSALCQLTHRRMPLRRVAIHRLVDDGGSRRWLTAVRVGHATHESPAEDPAQIELPSIDERPLWRDCVLAGRPRHLSGTPHQTLFPIADNSGTQGVLELHSDAPLADDHRRLIASLLGFHRQLRGLMDDNERDSLTGLLNRKSFDESFVRAAMAMEIDARLEPAAELEEPDRRELSNGARHWLAVVDIDHFKRVNDSHGHLIGDEVLLLVAQLMRQTFRHGDRIYRFGGEEFVVLLRCPQAQSARVAFERLRLRIGAHDFPQVGQLTVSIGYTAIDADDTPGAAFERADLAVYEAKHVGRNCTVDHADLAVQPSAEGPRGELEFF